MSYTVTAYTGDKVTVGYVSTRTPYTATVDAGMRGNVGFTGSVGPIGPIGYAGSRGNIGYTGSAGTANTDFVISDTIVTRHLEEYFFTYQSPSGLINHNYTIGNNLLLVRPTTNIALNLTNVTMPVNYSTSLKTSIIQQSNASFMINTMVINGIDTVIVWENGSPLSGNAGMINDISFNITRIANNTFLVKASTTTYS